MYSEKVFKNSIKLLTTPFFVMLLTFFAQRALNGKLDIQRHSKGTWALEHSKQLPMWVRRHLGNWATPTLEGCLCTRNSRHLGTQPLGHLGTQGTLFSRLFKPRVEDWMVFDSVYHPLLRGFQKVLFEAHTILTSNKKHIKLSLGKCFPWLICEKLAPARFF